MDLHPIVQQAIDHELKRLSGGAITPAEIQAIIQAIISILTVIGPYLGPTPAPTPAPAS